MVNSYTLKLILKAASPMLGVALVGSVVTGTVFAWAKNPKLNLSHIECTQNNQVEVHFVVVHLPQTVNNYQSVSYIINQDNRTAPFIKRSGDTGHYTENIPNTVSSYSITSAEVTIDGQKITLSNPGTVSLNCNPQTSTPSSSPTPSANPSATQSPTLNPIPTPTPSTPDCVKTDVKGRLQYTGNHISLNPVIGFFDNVATNKDCSDDVFVHVFGSRQEPESLGWLESQKHVYSKTVKIPDGARDFRVEIAVPNEDYCWYQVEVTRTPNVLIPPEYQGTEIIDYAFVKDTDSCVPPCTLDCGGTNVTNNTTNNTTNNNTTNNTTNVTNNSSTSEIKKLPETGPGTVAIATIGGIAPLGFALARFRKGKLYKEEQSLEEFASGIFKDRSDSLS